MKTPDISVVMSVHNNADTLSAALDSILLQEGVDLEFIVVDDGSTDGSAAILDEAARKDLRLKVVHARNEGLTRALIAACAKATAPWIARQDADDVSLPGRLKAQLERARQADAPVLVVCGADCQSPEGVHLYNVIPPQDNDQARRKILDLGETLCPHGAILVRSDGFRRAGGYRAPFLFAQDLDLVVRLAEHGNIAVMSEILYAFRFSPVSISGRHAGRQREFRRLLMECRTARKKGESEQNILDAAAALSTTIRAMPSSLSNGFAGLYFIGCCLGSRDPRLARSYLGRAVRARPWSIAAILRWMVATWRSADNTSRGKTCLLPSSHDEPVQFPVPLIRRTDYVKFALARRLWRMEAACASRISRCNVRVVGAYYSGNLGDWSMGWMTARIGRGLSFRPGLFDYSSAPDNRHPAIMGGGELGNAHHFEQILRQSSSPERIAACGINPVSNFSALPPSLLEKIARFAYLSVRSKAGADDMRAVLKRDAIEYNPDIAFGLFDQEETRQSPRTSRPVLAINLMTFYLSVQGRRTFAPDMSLVPVVADVRFAAMLERAGQQYTDFMRTLVREALSKGWEVVNIPFSPVDAMFADAVVGDLPVRRLPYVRDPLRAIGILRNCSKFVATRFHAHIFGLLARIPTISIGYAGKCQYLWQDLNLDPGQQLSRLDVCLNPRECADRIHATSGVVLPVAILARLANDARASVAKAYRAVAAAEQEV